MAIIAVLAAITIPNLLREKISANESAAQAALKVISSACETFAVANGRYPADETSMLLPNATPPYYNRTYCSQAVEGYSFSCSFSTTEYTIVARPATAQSGTRTFTITTGGVLTVP